MKKGNISGSIFILLFFLLGGICNAQIITTIAGNGTSGFSGDGGLATAAETTGPGGDVLFDNAGNIYFDDQNNARIREINPAGIIQTIAGNGTIGYSGDGGPAINAEFNQNTVITFDSSQNMYVVDYGNNCIREINKSGIITTFAGNGTPGYSGNGGPATAAELMGPCCVIADNAGNIYIADSWNNVIRKVDTKGIITLFAGNGTPGFNGDGGPATSAELNRPFRIVFDKQWNMYIADSFNSRIRKIDKAGIITTFAGTGTPGFGGDGGPAISAELNEPYGICIDAVGDIFIGDTYNNRIREIDPSGIITTVAGTGTGAGAYGGDGGPPLAAELNFPTGVSYHDCSLYVCDYDNNRIRKITYSSISITASKYAICRGQSSNLTASGDTSYTWSPAAGLSCTNCSNPVASPTVTTTYTVTGTISGPCGGTASITITVDTFNLKNLTITKDTTICSGSSITLSAGGGVNYQWNTGATTNSISVSHISSTQTYTVSISNGACAKDTGMTVTVIPSPKIYVSGNTKICPGDSTQFAVSGGTSYKWSNGATSNTFYLPSVTKDTTISVTAYNSLGCSHDTSITVLPEPPALSACCNAIIATGNDTTLIAHGNAAKSYEWLPTVNCLNPLCDSVKVSPTVTTTYTVTATDSAGCQVERIITIVVEIPCADFTIPNVFTPNYAGILGLNSLFYIKTFDIQSWSISIYDRWGKEVFSTLNPNQYWDGNTENGGKAPDGVYYYIITASCQNNSFKKDGFIQLR